MLGDRKDRFRSLHTRLPGGALVELGALPSTDEVLRGEFGHGQLWVGKVEDFP